MTRNLLLCAFLLSCDSDKGLTVHNATPEATIVSHYAEEEVTEGTQQEFVAALTDPDDSTRDLTARWTIGGEEVCTFDAPDENGDTHCIHVMETGDEDVTVEVRDPKNATATATITLVILPAANQPPEAPSVEIHPNPAATTDDLVAEASGGIDPEGAEVTFTWQWYQDSQATTHTSDTVPATDTTKGETWRVVVTPSDGEDAGPTAEDTVTITNTDPAIDSVNIVDASSQSITTAAHGDTITSVATWSDADGESDATIPNEWTNAGGISWGTAADLNINLAGTGAAEGEVLTCTVTVDDSEGNPATGSASVTLEGCDPYAEEIPYDGFDSNCDGLESLNDADGDGIADDTSLDYNEDGAPDLGVECAGTWASTVYYLYCDLRLYWDTGNQFCQDNGYDSLATTTDSSENSALAGLVESTDSTIHPSLPYDYAASSLIGYTRFPSYQTPSAPVDGHGFSWVDSSHTSFTNWKSGEPNGGATGEDCVEFVYNSSYRGQWNDCFCYDGQHSTWASPRRHVSCSVRP